MSVSFVRMLGYVHDGQPTVILRVSIQRGEKVNAWICACQEIGTPQVTDQGLPGEPQEMLRGATETGDCSEVGVDRPP